MGKVFDGIDEHQRDWIGRQALFFVGSAPLAGDGHVNVSPKGPIGSLRVLDEHTVAYLDIVGSGAETIAHLRENGRIVLMVCAFEGPPRIVRLHGRGRAIVDGDPEYAQHITDFPDHAGSRAIIEVGVERIADSCGYNVPRMSFEQHRTNLDHWTAKKSADALVEYRRAKNSESIDGLPALDHS